MRNYSLCHRVSFVEYLVSLFLYLLQIAFAFCMYDDENDSLARGLQIKMPIKEQESSTFLCSNEPIQ